MAAWVFPAAMVLMAVTVEAIAVAMGTGLIPAFPWVAGSARANQAPCLFRGTEWQGVISSIDYY